MILSPEVAKIVKRAIDLVNPEWRQVTSCYPGMVMIKIHGLTQVVASGSSNEVFGAGHLENEEWWVSGGVGVAVRGRWDILEAIGEDSITGWIHFQRYGLLSEGECPSGEAKRHFADHRGEYSALYPVTFRRNGSGMYPWRAIRRDTEGT